jgi:hypothetical protein
MKEKQRENIVTRLLCCHSQQECNLVFHFLGRIVREESDDATMNTQHLKVIERGPEAGNSKVHLSFH